MNEDEQILCFSLYKSKMLQCSQKLLVIFDYKRFHELMACVRKLEADINQYQDTLRTHIYEGEMIRYRGVGREKVEEFLEKYSKRFEEFEQTKRDRVEQLEMERRLGREHLEQDLTSDNKMVKFKPKRELREYLKNERLVALEERIEEAANYRKELDRISQRETVRLNKNVREYVDSKLKSYDQETDKQKAHLQVKIDNDENKLRIKMAREFDVLIKKNALHEYSIPH